MRLEIDIADERPEVKILSAISDSSAFVLELVCRAGQTTKPASTPDYMGSIAKIQRSSNRLEKTDEVDSYLAEVSAQW